MCLHTHSVACQHHTFRSFNQRFFLENQNLLSDYLFWATADKWTTVPNNASKKIFCCCFYVNAHHWGDKACLLFILYFDTILFIVSNLQIKSKMYCQSVHIRYYIDCFCSTLAFCFQWFWLLLVWRLLGLYFFSNPMIACVILLTLIILHFNNCNMTYNWTNTNTSVFFF